MSITEARALNQNLSTNSFRPESDPEKLSRIRELITTDVDLAKQQAGLGLGSYSYRENTTGCRGFLAKVLHRNLLMAIAKVSL